jgi:hypothetical protein
MLKHKIEIEIERLVYILIEIDGHCMFYSYDDYVQEYDYSHRNIELKLYKRNDDGLVHYKNYNYSNIKFSPIERNHVYYGQYLFIFNNTALSVNYNPNDFSFKIDDYQKNEFNVDENLC